MVPIFVVEPSKPLNKCCVLPFWTNKWTINLIIINLIIFLINAKVKLIDAATEQNEYSNDFSSSEESSGLKRPFNTVGIDGHNKVEA